MKSLQQKLILVAGGAGDIGSAVVAELVKYGASVVSLQRTLFPFRRHTPEPDHPSVIRRHPFDAVRESDWRGAMESVMDQFGKIDGLVFCVGSLPATDFAMTTPEEFQRQLETNVLSYLVAMHVLLPIFKSQGEGSIVVVGSLGGVVPMPFQALYAACKYAVRGCTLSLSEELHGTRIALSLLSAGPVQSRMMSQAALRSNSAISFINRPLPTQRVAMHVCRLLRHPKRELILPRFMVPSIRLANLSPSLFHLFNRLLHPIGVWRQRRYHTSSVGFHDVLTRRESICN